MIFPSLAMETYQKGPGISSSTLIEMDVSPAHFYHFWKRELTKPTPAQEKGTLFHDLLLEQNVDKYIARPLTDDLQLVRANSKEYKEFLAKNPGKTPVHPADYNEMYSILTAFTKSEKAMGIYNGAKIEHSILAKDPETGLEIKARPDIWGPGYIADLKSTANILKFDNQIFTLSYDVRLVHYAKCIEIVTGEKIKDFYFIAFESAPPYGIQVVKLSSEDVAIAENKWRELMNKVSVCMKTNQWPGFPEEIRVAKRPKFLQELELSFEEAG